MKPFHLLTNWPAGYDAGEAEILVQAELHEGETASHDYPGSPPSIEMLCAVDMKTGHSIDITELPPWLQDDLRGRVEEYLRERETA